ncbi:hypothetical protein [Paradevosia shaoguanensis]|uniref:hypothetical protein n=1 Tax=Paradevosia shaoguanensis TaxID=1335043 RepID=UPI003C775692
MAKNFSRQSLTSQRIAKAQAMALQASDEADLFYRLRNEGGFNLGEMAAVWPSLTPGNRRAASLPSKAA